MSEEPIKTEGTSPAPQTPSETSVPLALVEEKVPPLGGPSERLKGWVDVVNKSAQVIALMAAGLWGFWLFTKTTEPGLTPRVTVEVGLDWTPMASGEDCQADISATVKNPGVSPAVIDRAKIKIWLYDLSAKGNSLGPNFFPSGGKPQSLDLFRISRSKPDYYADETDNRLLWADLITTYSPNDSNTNHQVFVFPKSPNTLALVYVEATGGTLGMLPWGRRPIFNYGYAIDRVCGSHQQGTQDSR